MSCLSKIPTALGLMEGIIAIISLVLLLQAIQRWLDDMPHFRLLIRQLRGGCTTWNKHWKASRPLIRLQKSKWWIFSGIYLSTSISLSKTINSRYRHFVPFLFFSFFPFQAHCLLSCSWEWDDQAKASSSKKSGNKWLDILVGFILLLYDW